MCSDTFTVAVIYGRRMCNDSFSRYVGTGSSMYDLVGDDIMMRWTSSSLQTSNSVRDVDAWRDGTFVGGLRAVLARTDFTFSSKKWMKSSAVRVILPK